VRPARQSHVHRWYIFAVYVKVILSIRLKLSSFYHTFHSKPHFHSIGSDYCYLHFVVAHVKLFLSFQSEYRCNTSMRPSVAIKSSMWPSVENVCPPCCSTIQYCHLSCRLSVVDRVGLHWSELPDYPSHTLLNFGWTCVLNILFYPAYIYTKSKGGRQGRLINMRGWTSTLLTKLEFSRTKCCLINGDIIRRFCLQCIILKLVVIERSLGQVIFPDVGNFLAELKQTRKYKLGSTEKRCTICNPPSPSGLCSSSFAR